MTLEQFYEAYPRQSMKINGKDFIYRYYKNENSKNTLVLLTGGIGLSDLFYQHFHRFAENFSVITFDYSEAFPTMSELADAAAVLFEKLNVRVWLVGQSLGGIVAQIITKRHSDRIEGLVLSNTVPLLDYGGAAEYFAAAKKRQTKSRKLIKIMPFEIAKKAMLKTINRKVQMLPEESRETFSSLVPIMLDMLTKEYELHMIDLILDCENHLNMKKSDFSQLDGRVMLILADDDDTFNDDSKSQLIELMTNPKVITDIGGGHLGALMQIDRYINTVTNYILGRN